MAKKIENVLTQEFLAELYHCCIINSQICGVVVQHMEDSLLPDSQFQMLNETLRTYFQEYKSAPGYGVLTQKLSASRAVSELLEEIRDTASGADSESVRDMFETYLKLTRYKKILKDVNKKYEEGQRIESLQLLTKELNELNKFTLKPEALIEVATTWESRLRENKEKMQNSTLVPVNQYFIDGLDAVNQGRDLRTQLSICMALSGIGKTFYSVWHGYSAAYLSGQDVLHFSLEGTDKELLDRYSALLAHCSAHDYSIGAINQHTVDTLRTKLETFAGTLRVRAYQRFGKEISTMDLKIELDKYKERFNKYPDTVIIDSLDLLTDNQVGTWDFKNLRHKRLAVAQNLADLAGECNCHVLATYQAAIEDQSKIQDEKFVLSAFNASECRGLQRPATTFFTLNQSRKEYSEGIMRIHLDKMRFAKKCPPFRIATDYENGAFYDRVRTLSLPNEE